MRIYDGNNQSRITWETDTSGRPMKAIQDEANLGGQRRIWAWDGFDANKRRRDIFPDYKKRRVKAPDEFYKTIKIIKKMLVHTDAIQMEVDGYEADDVIATVVVGWDRNEPVHILSTDRDLQPLRTLKNVTTSQNALLNVMPQDIRLYKTFVGDSSDSIPGLPGFGKKAWETANKQQLRELIEGKRGPTQVDGLSPRCLNWLLIPSNFTLLQSMWKCIELLDVPSSLIVQNMRVGVRNDAAAAKVMLEFLQ